MVGIKNFEMPHNYYNCELHNYHECADKLVMIEIKYNKEQTDNENVD